MQIMQIASLRPHALPCGGGPPTAGGQAAGGLASRLTKGEGPPMPTGRHAGRQATVALERSTRSNSRSYRINVLH